MIGSLELRPKRRMKKSPPNVMKQRTLVTGIELEYLNVYQLGDSWCLRSSDGSDAFPLTTLLDGHIRELVCNDDTTDS